MTAPAGGPPLFIVGCPRSGTTLLASLLDRHTQIAVAPETFFFRDGYLKVRSLARPGAISALLSEGPLVELGLDPAQISVRGSNVLHAVMSAYAAKCGKPRWAEKTPIHLFYVRRILEWFPDARILALIRDGRDVARSLRAAPFTHRRLWMHARFWCRCARLVRHLAETYPGSVQVVRFEELVSGPERVVREIDAFIGVPFEAGQLTVTSGSGHVLPREDSWKRSALEAVDPGRAMAWRTSAGAAERAMMQGLMASELALWSYPPDETAPRGLLRRTFYPVASACLDAALAARLAVYHPAVHPGLRSLKRVLRPSR